MPPISLRMMAPSVSPMPGIVVMKEPVCFNRVEISCFNFIDLAFKEDDLLHKLPDLKGKSVFCKSNTE